MPYEDPLRRSVEPPNLYRDMISRKSYKDPLRVKPVLVEYKPYNNYYEYKPENIDLLTGKPKGSDRRGLEQNQNEGGRQSLSLPPIFPHPTPSQTTEQGEIFTASDEFNGDITITSENEFVRSTTSALTNSSRDLSVPSSSSHMELRTQDKAIKHQLAKLRIKPSAPTTEVTIRRSHIVEDVLSVYRRLNVSHKLKVQFEGEKGLDFGGLTKDMFSCFWPMAFEKYFKGENAAVPHLSTTERHFAKEVFPALGKIMEHMLRLLGTLPTTICRSCLLWMASEDYEVDAHLLLEDYFLFLPEADGKLLKQCLSSPFWSDGEKRRLLLFSSSHSFNAFPTAKTLKRLLLNVAQKELLDEPCTFLRLMYAGISNSGKKFFRCLNPMNIRHIFTELKATPEKVANLLENVFEEKDLSTSQVIVLNYLSNLVRSMDSYTLQKFLVWVTGSPSMPDELEISFNTSAGLMRAPIARTCGNLLELPEDYGTYEEFKKELLHVINSVDAMEMHFL